MSEQCPACHADLPQPSRLPGGGFTSVSETSGAESVTCSDCGAKLSREPGEDWHRTDGGYEPSMSREEAAAFVTSASDKSLSQFIEADAVRQDLPWNTVDALVKRSAEANPDEA